MDQDKTKKAKAYCKQFTMVDVPIHIVKDFVSDVEVIYGNIYWVKLQDLMRKAEAYDVMMMEMGKSLEEDVKEEVQEPEIKTFSGDVMKKR